MNYVVAVDGCFLDRPSGSARVAWDMAMLMRDRGHDVAMLCNSQPVGRMTLGNCEEHEGICICRYERPRIRWWNSRMLDDMVRTAAAAAAQMVGNRQWDLVHIHTLVPGAGVRRAFGVGPRYVYTVHSPVVAEQRINWAAQGLLGTMKRVFGERSLQRVERDLLRQADAIHTLSDYTRSEVQRRYGLGHKVTVVPHWRDENTVHVGDKASARDKLGWPHGIPILFTLRRHVPRMGLDVAVKAVAPLARTGACVFYIGGDGPLRANLEATARALGAGEKQVCFLGRVSDEELPLMYQASDLFILPTLALECFGLIMLEAMGYGCPVLGTNVGSIPEILEPICPQLIVPPGDVPAIAARVRSFLDGGLGLPEREELSAFVLARYARRIIEPRIAGLLEGTAMSARVEAPD